MTTTELRALLSRPVMPREEMVSMYAEFSALLDIAERLGAADEPINHEGITRCLVCDEDMETDFVDHAGIHYKGHASDCAWVAARALVGGE